MKPILLKQVKALPLQLALVVPFVLQTVAAVGLVGYLSFRNGQQAVNDLANQLTHKAADLVDQHLDSYLATPQKLNQVNAEAIKLGLLDVRDRQTAGRYFWQQMHTYDLTYIGYALTTGEGAGAGRYDGKTVLIDDWSANPPNNLSTYNTDEQGNRIGTPTIGQYDTFNESWYAEPVKAGRPIWSSIYVWDYPENPYITLSAGRPIYNASNQLLGMVGTDIHLLKLGDFLNELAISPSGQVFIIERDGMLIADSSPQHPFARVEGQLKRISAFESTNPLVQGMARQLQQRFNGFTAIHQRQSLQLDVQDERHFVEVMPWQDEYGLDWLVVIVVPESDFMSQIDANTRTTLFLCLIALIVAIALGSYTSRWIARPILRLNRASAAIANGNLDQTVEIGGIREISHLAESFNRMASQLRESFNELEKSNTELEHRVEDRTQELRQKNGQLQATLEELHRTQTHMVQSEKMSALGQMVAGVAHEINNPVNFIHGNLPHVDAYTHELLQLVQAYQHHYPNPPQTLQDHLEAVELEFLSDDLTKILQSMKVGTDRIREIVLSLRNFSRLDESEFKAVDIHEGLENTLVILRHRLKARTDRPEIQVVKIYDQIPLVECYAGQLNQVFINILSNAIDALEDSNQGRSYQEIVAHPNIITIETSMTKDQQVKIAISDNGPGVPEQVKSKLFDPFFTTKAVGKGTGLGLSISYQIVTDKHGGQLRCSSSAQGTTFEIEIPLRQPALAMNQMT